MKILTVFLIACLTYNAECGRRVLKPLDKSANVDFINKEGGGGVRPAPGPVKPGNNPQPAKPAPAIHKASVSVVTPPTYQVAEPLKPQPKPAVANVVTQPQPAHVPAQPGKAASATKTFPQGPQPQTTPGPGSVKQLITFYDSKGQASPIRPYSYSQAVKKGIH